MRRLGLTAVLGSIALAIPLAVAPPAGATPLLVGCDQAATRIVVTTDVVLDPSCTYTAGIDVTASDVTLDCRGARIHSDGQTGIGIVVRTPATVALSNVTVTGCRVEGFLNSVRVTRDGFRDLPLDHPFDHPTSDITIRDGDFSGSHGVGVYVDAYSSDVSILDNDIHDSGSSGIYLETGSKENLIEGNRLVHDGYTENGTEGEQLDLGGSKVWYWGTGREGISVDGSTDNVIRGNRIEGNSAGGIFLYKNCGEYPDRPSWIPRLVHADRNLIEGNAFAHQRNGVWVGARMGENTLPMECSDPAYVDRPGVRVSLDYAQDDVVRGNSFTDVTYGVRVEDDRTTVEGNTFAASSPDHHAVIIGTPFRTDVLHQPVDSTVLRGNTSTIAGNDSPYRWVHGQVHTTVEGNTALGAPAGICRGEPVPRELFVMVIAVAAALPDGSKPPTPDLTVPTLGALASCRSRSTPPPGPTTSTSVPAAAADGARPVPGSPAYTG